jgi:hypothetical protein
VVVAHHLDGGRWSIGYIAVDGAVAVIHGTHKLARSTLLALALALSGPVDAVARLRLGGRSLLEELLLLPRLVLVSLGRSLLGRLRRRLLLGRRLQHLGLLGLRRALLARLVLAAAAAAAMPLRRRLTIVRRWPHFWLGLGWFCRHAYTSWNFTAGFIGLWSSTAFKNLRLAFLDLPGPVRTGKSAVAGEVNAGQKEGWQTWVLRNTLPEIPGILTLDRPDPLWFTTDITLRH